MLATGTKSGYTFALSGGAGTPAMRYLVEANPQPNSGVRKFCSDQSGEFALAPRWTLHRYYDTLQ